MKQCVAPVSKRMATCRTPWAVERNPDSRGLKVGFARTQGRNSAAPASAASSARMAAARASTEAEARSAACAARRSSSAACASHAPPAGANHCGRCGVPRDESQGVQSRGTYAAIPGGRKVGTALRECGVAAVGGKLPPARLELSQSLQRH